MNTLAKGLAWKLLERFGVQGVQFVLQIILARLLDPAHYGVLSLMLIFTTIANVFVQNGFNTALIQNKDVTEEDYSSVFWVSLGISVILYVLVYLATPWIAAFYKMPDIVVPMRVLALVLIPGAFNSVQLAKVSREMDFKKVFLSNVGGIIVSGLAGIALAYAGAGLWALVVQYLLNIAVACIVMLFTVRWFPRLVINWKRIAVLFAYGWKLLVSALIDTVYQDLRSLVIGKKYDGDTLGYYNRGKQFPQFIINAINGAVQSVMLPAMSSQQDDRKQMKTMTRQSIMLSSYIIFPMMAGLACVADTLVRLLLTDKWAPCVPYMQIYCFTMAFWPVHTTNLQAINAMGRSDVFLKLEIIKKVIGLASLLVAVFCFDSPVAIAMTGVFTAFTSCFINAYPNKSLMGYSYLEQMRDILPSLLMALVMGAAVLLVGQVQMALFLKLLLQIMAGVAVFLVLSMIVRPEPYRELMAKVRGILGRRN